MKVTIEMTKMSICDKFTPFMKKIEVYSNVDKFEINRLTFNEIDITLYGYAENSENDKYLSKTIHLDGYFPCIIVEK